MNKLQRSIQSRFQLASAALKKWRRYVVTCVIAVAAVGGVAASGTAHAEDTMQQMLSQHTLRIGWISAPPTAYKDLKTGEVTGIYIDMMKAILAQINVKPVFVETSWSTFPAGLQAKQFDIVTAGTFASIPRATAVAFTQPIFFLGYTAVVRNGDTRFKTLEDIDKPGIKVAVIQGSGGQEYVKRAFSHAQIEALSTSDLTASVNAVATGRADAAIEDAWASRRYMEANPGKLISLFGDHPFNNQAIAFPVRPDDQIFLNFMNTSLQWMAINGLTEQIVKKYPPSGRFIATQTFKPID